MKQFLKIFNFELNNYLKNKIFVGITLFLMVVIAVLMFIPQLVDAFTQSDEITDDSKPIMLVKSEIDDSEDALKTSFSLAFTDYDIEFTDEDITDIKDKISSDIVNCAFVITGETSYTYYVKDLSLYDSNSSIADSILKNIYQTNAMIKNGISLDKSQEITNIVINSNIENLGVNQSENFFYTYIMIFSLYTVILLYGQMVAVNVATEKSSRAMELLITSANPTSMMFGKVLASCLAGLIQLIAIFGTSLLFYNINKSHWIENDIIKAIFDIPLSLFIFMLIFFLLGFFIYAFLFGAVGSTASKLEDINTSVTPITMLFIASFMVVIYSFSASDMNNILIKICSFIPFTSPMAMFARIAMSDVSPIEIIISIAILTVSVICVGIISAKIYRIGVLLYGNQPKITSIIKSIIKG